MPSRTTTTTAGESSARPSPEQSPSPHRASSDTYDSNTHVASGKFSGATFFSWCRQALIRLPLTAPRPAAGRPAAAATTRTRSERFLDRKGERRHAVLPVVPPSVVPVLRSVTPVSVTRGAGCVRRVRGVPSLWGSCGTRASYCRIRRLTSDEVITLRRVHLTLHQADGSNPSTGRRVAAQGSTTGAFPSATPRLSGLWSPLPDRLPQCRRKPGGVTERQFGPSRKSRSRPPTATAVGFLFPVVLRRSCRNARLTHSGAAPTGIR